MKNLTWFVPDHIIHGDLPEVLSGEFMSILDKEVTALLDTASQTVHFIMDASKVKSFPDPKAALNISYYGHPKLGKLIVFGLKSNPFLSFLSTLVSHSAGVKIKIFETLDEAQAYLATLDIEKAS
jgi:hypothetical protein